MKPNGKHGVVDENSYAELLELIQNIDSWFKYCFNNGSRPPGTPTVRIERAADHDGLSRDRSCRWERQSIR